MVTSNRTSIDRSTSFLQRTASTASAGRPERRSSRPEKRPEEYENPGVSRNPESVKTPRTKPEGEEENSPLICELNRTNQPVAPPRRKRPVPGPVTLHSNSIILVLSDHTSGRVLLGNLLKVKEQCCQNVLLKCHFYLMM